MSNTPAIESVKVRQYLTITGNYWAFTLTDGALRMLVILHFHALGYSPLSIAMLFLFYEVFGVITLYSSRGLFGDDKLVSTMGIAAVIMILSNITIWPQMLGEIREEPKLSGIDSARRRAVVFVRQLDVIVQYISGLMS